LASSRLGWKAAGRVQRRRYSRRGCGRSGLDLDIPVLNTTAASASKFSSTFSVRIQQDPHQQPLPPPHRIPDTYNAAFSKIPALEKKFQFTDWWELRLYDARGNQIEWPNRLRIGGRMIKTGRTIQFYRKVDEVRRLCVRGPSPG